jgi:histidine triad (HIT) family protein
MTERCIFCDILAGRAPASIVCEEADCVAFMDIAAINPGHVLVVPRQHAPGLAELDPQAGASMFRLAQRVALALRRSSLRCEGVNLVLSDGPVAGQEVMHVHLHVLPRYRGDGFGFRLGPGGRQVVPRSELDEIAGRISRALDHG